MSDTPRTDAVIGHHTGWSDQAKYIISFARQLERELAAALARPEEARWKLAESDELPPGSPVEPGTTLYAFRHLDEGHWEYELPPLPSRVPQERS